MNARRLGSEDSVRIETDRATWCDLTAAVDLTMHPAMRLRLQDAVSAPDRTHFG